MKKLTLFLTSLAVGLGGFTTPSLHADEHLFGWVRGAETLPAGHFDAYQFVTLRTGKVSGQYHAWDYDTEVEYGITDQFQVGVSVTNHYFNLKNVEELDNGKNLLFGGVEASAKYRLLSPFKDGIGLALRMEGGYLVKDDVGGLDQKEWFINPQIILHKNYLDDTLIFHFNTGVQFAWGKKPAEEYDHELALEAGVGASYRFAPNWFAGVETHFRSEYPKFDMGNFEHCVLFAGPSIHYGAKNWWATLSYSYQVFGNEVDQVTNGKAYAEEARNETRLKVGFNF
ncbi:MAG: DUF6662 family protein [Chthoniobacterales bacterium]